MVIQHVSSNLPITDSSLHGFSANTHHSCYHGYGVIGVHGNDTQTTTHDVSIQ